ncbi:hypothetical protein [uncultured Jannaschia sp.]|uniref:hypothetical protein n=1 Tax=uncultured Jannaschia sp. TaxID=293347 RepID=UPI002616F19A|nr:hypothetical protein [uncultured Jannaschia sp.]
MTRWAHPSWSIWIGSGFWLGFSFSAFRAGDGALFQAAGAYPICTAIIAFVLWREIETIKVQDLLGKHSSSLQANIDGLRAFTATVMEFAYGIDIVANHAVQKAFYPNSLQTIPRISGPRDRLANEFEKINEAFRETSETIHRFQQYSIALRSESSKRVRMTLAEVILLLTGTMQWAFGYLLF